MSEFRRIMMSSFLMLLLHFTAAEVKHYFHIVRVGDEVTLTFENVINDQDKCESTTWYVSNPRISEVVMLFEDGQIHKDLAKAKSDRLRVENCSLVIKNVTEEDAGGYTCRQFRSGEQQGSGSEVHLSVVTMTEHQDNDEVTLSCSVTRRGECRHSAKWLLQGQDVDKDHREINTSQSSCSASVTFQTSHFSNTTRSELFTCEVTDKKTTEVHLFPFSPQSSGEVTKPAATNLPPPTTTTTTASTATTETTTETNTNSGEDTKPATTNLPPRPPPPSPPPQTTTKTIATTTTSTATTTETNKNSGEDTKPATTNLPPPPTRPPSPPPQTTTKTTTKTIARTTTSTATTTETNKNSGEDTQPATTNRPAPPTQPPSPPPPPTPPPSQTTTTTTTATITTTSTASTTETKNNSLSDLLVKVGRTSAVSLQSSGDDAGKVATMSTIPIKPTLTKAKTTSEKTGQVCKNPGWWWWIIVVIVGVAALIIITVAVIRRKRTQGTDTETDDNVSPCCLCVEIDSSWPC